LTRSNEWWSDEFWASCDQDHERRQVSLEAQIAVLEKLAREVGLKTRR
jgi:hypothetical protein